MKVLASLEDIPDLLRRVAELAAGNAGTQAVVADTYRLVLERVGEVIVALRHGTNKDANALLRPQRLEVVPNPDHGRFKTHRHLAAVGRQMIRDRILDYSQQFFLRVGGTD